MDRFGAQSEMRMTRLAVVLKGEKVSLTMDGVVIASSKDSVTGRVYERIAACVNACEGMDQFADGFKFIEYIKKTDDDIRVLAARLKACRGD